MNIDCIIRQYFAAKERMNEVCSRTKFNDPERKDAIVRYCRAAVAIDALQLSARVGRTFFNVWD